MAQYELTYTFADGEGNKATVSATVQAANEAAAVLRAETLGESLILISDAELVGCSFSRVIDIAGMSPTAADPQSNVEEKGMFSWRTASGFLTRFSVPAIKDAVKVANSDTLDTAEINVAAIVTEVTTQGWSDKRGSDITVLVSAVQSYGKKR